MGFLSGLIGVAALAGLPVIEESVTVLKPAPMPGFAGEWYSVIPVPVPARPPEHSFYRLRVGSSGRGRVWLDGTPLAPNEDGDFDLLNLNRRRPSRVTVAPATAGEALLIETPRVFVSRYEVHGSSARLWVRNSLENTVNVYMTISGSAGGREVEASATVPPATTQIITLSGPFSASGPPWRIMLEKQEEAMEGGYRFLTITQPRTPPTVNSYVKP